MRKKLQYAVLFLVGFMAVFVIFNWFMVFVFYDPFMGSYQRAIVRQYDHYKGLEGRKIVFIGNSCLAFGFNLDEMERLTGENCAILGNHENMGLTYFIEMSKSNLASGDIVVIEYADNSRGEVGAELLLTGIGKRLDMYAYFPNRHEIIKYIPYLIRKNIFGGFYSLYRQIKGKEENLKRDYSLAAFDYRGNMTFERDQCIIPKPYIDEIAKENWWISFQTNYDSGFIEYLNEYTAYCRALGVQVYIIRKCYLDVAVKSTKQEIEISDRALDNALDAVLITDSTEYLYDSSLMYDLVAHCNTEGAKKRTEQLYIDLVTHGVLRVCPADPEKRLQARPSRHKP